MKSSMRVMLLRNGECFWRLLNLEYIVSIMIYFFLISALFNNLINHNLMESNTLSENTKGNLSLHATQNLSRIK